MKTICVNRDVLIAAVTANYEAHKIEVAEAKKEYQAKLEAFGENFAGYLNERRRLGELKATDFSTNQPKVGLVMPIPPAEHIEDYQRALDQLNLCCDEEVVLEAREFDELARDEWVWKDHYVHTNSAYSASLRGKTAG